MMKKTFAVAVSLAAVVAFGARDAAWMQQTNLLERTEEAAVAELPNVLILGDSISMGYTPFVKRRLAGVANVSRPKCNCAASQFYFRKGNGMKEWVGTNRWDAIVVNFGIWDVCYMRGAVTGSDHFWGSEIKKKLPPLEKGTAIRDLGFRIRTPVREYEANMRRILAFLKSTGAKVFFALSTPVPCYQDDRCGMIRVYNEIAESVCAELGVGVIDLYAVAERNYDKIKDGCHFNDEGNDLLAAAIVAAIRPKEKFLALEAPITRWVDAIPLGNGQAGALVWGEGDELRFTLDRADYWHQRRNPMFDDPRFKWRNLVSYTNDYEKLKSVFIVREDPTKLPGVRLVAKLAGGAKCRRFTLDIGDGSSEIVLDTPAGERTMRAWFDDDSPFLSLVVPTGVAFASLAFTTNSAFDKLGGYPEPRVEISGKGAFYRRGNRIGAKGPWVRDFAAGVRFLPAEAKPDSAFWKRFWSVSEVRIPDPKLQHFYDFAMYCYGAASRPPHAPIALQAVWTADNGGLPPWHGDYHMDMNVQETYWAAPVAGHLDALDAFADHMVALLPELQKYGRDFFDMKNGGAAIPGHMAYDGSFIAGGAMWALPLVHGLWAFAQVYDAWAYRPTPERLEKIWPLAAALAEGADQVLLPPDADGVRRYAVSATPEVGENTAEAVAFAPNTTYDRSITRGFFKQVANLAAAKGDRGARDRFLKIASSLGKPNLDAKGRYLLDAGTPLASSHRHPSHLHDVFPYFDVDPGADARAAYAAYIALGRGKWGGHTLPECACKAAALADGDEALFCLNEFAGHYVSRNGFHINYYYETAVRPDRPPRDVFTLESNLAFARGVQEMLLAGRADAIAVFPALPKAWDGKEISFRDLVLPGGHRVSAKRVADGTITGSVTGFSAVETTVILPGGERREVTLRPGKETPFAGR